MADPETREQKIQRVRDAVAARRADILTGGIEAGRLAEDLHVPAGMVSAVFREAAAAQGDLRLRVEQQRVTLYHAAVGREGADAAGADSAGIAQRVSGRRR